MFAAPHLHRALESASGGCPALSAPDCAYDQPSIEQLGLSEAACQTDSQAVSRPGPLRPCSCNPVIGRAAGGLHQRSWAFGRLQSHTVSPADEGPSCSSAQGREEGRSAPGTASCLLHAQHGVDHQCSVPCGSMMCDCPAAPAVPLKWCSHAQLVLQAPVAGDEDGMWMIVGE